LELQITMEKGMCDRFSVHSARGFRMKFQVKDGRIKTSMSRSEMRIGIG
jgi:hypothetical protein